MTDSLNIPELERKYERHEMVFKEMFKYPRRKGADIRVLYSRLAVKDFPDRRDRIAIIKFIKAIRQDYLFNNASNALPLKQYHHDYYQCFNACRVFGLAIARSLKEQRVFEWHHVRATVCKLIEEGKWFIPYKNLICVEQFLLQNNYIFQVVRHLNLEGQQKYTRKYGVTEKSKTMLEGFGFLKGQGKQRNLNAMRLAKTTVDGWTPLHLKSADKNTRVFLDPYNEPNYDNRVLKKANKAEFRLFNRNDIRITGDPIAEYREYGSRGAAWHSRDFHKRLAEKTAKMKKCNRYHLHQSALLMKKYIDKRKEADYVFRITKQDWKKIPQKEKTSFFNAIYFHEAMYVTRIKIGGRWYDSNHYGVERRYLKYDFNPELDQNFIVRFNIENRRCVAAGEKIYQLDEIYADVERRLRGEESQCRFSDRIKDPNAVIHNGITEDTDIFADISTVRWYKNQFPIRDDWDMDLMRGYFSMVPRIDAKPWTLAQTLMEFSRPVPNKNSKRVNARWMYDQWFAETKKFFEKAEKEAIWNAKNIDFTGKFYKEYEDEPIWVYTFTDMDTETYPHLEEIEEIEYGLSPDVPFRVFNEDATQGGRYYGFNIQRVSGALRKFLAVSRRESDLQGEGIYKTTEIDFKSLHPTLLYTIAQEKAPEDPYKVFSYPREEVKIAMNVMINSANKGIAEKAVRNFFVKKLNYRSGNPCLSKVYINKMFEEIEKAHPKICKFFYTGVGIKLQNVDSIIATEVMMKFYNVVERRYNDKNAIIFPIHDSFIVEERYGSLLKWCMEKAFKEVLMTEVMPRMEVK